jgi:hypothetical protein
MDDCGPIAVGKIIKTTNEGGVINIDAGADTGCYFNTGCYFDVEDPEDLVVDPSN